MASVQCFGDSGTASLAKVIFSSVPQTPHRYLSFTARSSPGGGASGIGRESPPSIVSPIIKMASETATAMITLMGLSCVIRRMRRTAANAANMYLFRVFCTCLSRIFAVDSMGMSSSPELVLPRFLS